MMSLSTWAKPLLVKDGKIIFLIKLILGDLNIFAMDGTTARVACRLLWPGVECNFI
jgi:hypothetical protein